MWPYLLGGWFHKYSRDREQRWKFGLVGRGYNWQKRRPEYFYVWLKFWSQTFKWGGPMGVEKAWPMEGNPKNIFWTLPKLQKCPNQFGTDNAQKKGCLFLGFCPLLFCQNQYIPTIPHQSPPPPQTASPRHYFFSGKLKAHDRGRCTLANLQR